MTRFTTLLSVSAISLVLAAQAQAANTFTIDQAGAAPKHLTIDQEGETNTSNVIQHGDGAEQRIQIQQKWGTTAQPNVVNARQYGPGHKAFLFSTGPANTIGLTQGSSGAPATNNYADVKLTGRGNAFTGVSNGDNNTIDHDVIGDQNTVNVTASNTVAGIIGTESYGLVEGVENKLTVNSTGYNYNDNKVKGLRNDVTTRQTSTATSSSASADRNVAQSVVQGERNRLEHIQNGKGNAVWSTIQGVDSVLTSNQQGDNNKANSGAVGKNHIVGTGQTGNNNVAEAFTEGENGDVTVRQDGNGNTGRASTAGKLTTASIRQTGNSNTAITSVTGMNSKSTLNQTGNTNTVWTGHVQGANNTQTGVQSGNGNSLGLGIDGDNSSLAATQTGDSNAANIFVAGANETHITYTATGNGNVAKSSVKGDFNNATLRQTGNANVLEANLLGGSSSNALNITQVRAGGTFGNDAKLSIGGAGAGEASIGNNVVFTQNGGDHRITATVSPRSHGNELLVDQSGGLGNVADIFIAADSSENGIDVDQTGSTNVFGANITGFANGVGGQQVGTGNEFYATQVGAFNVVGFYQNGTGNKATANQNGEGHRATFSQNGDNNTASITQTGLGQVANVAQTGNGHTTHIIQH